MYRVEHVFHQSWRTAHIQSIIDDMAAGRGNPTGDYHTDDQCSTACQANDSLLTRTKSQASEPGCMKS